MSAESVWGVVKFTRVFIDVLCFQSNIIPSMFTGSQRAMICMKPAYAAARDAFSPNTTNVCCATTSNGPIPPTLEGIAVIRFEVAVTNIIAKTNIIGEGK